MQALCCMNNCCLYENQQNVSQYETYLGRMEFGPTWYNNYHLQKENENYFLNHPLCVLKYFSYTCVKYIIPSGNQPGMICLAAISSPYTRWLDVGPTCIS